MQSRANAVWVVAAAVCVSTVSALAGPCTADISQLESTVRISTTNSLAGPTGQQTIAAQLGHQPTQDSVRQAEEQARARVESILSRAKALDTQGRADECARAVREAKLLLDLQ
ncbi:MAG TPA: hypothetical protein VGO08_22155 [Burkholderiales bacterium]|nr:hypothetical protein [Burkholderiales bacterium]